jgi:glycine/sarcosine N-methyltransferase
MPWEISMYDTFSQDYDYFVNWKNRLEMEIPFLTEQIQKFILKPVPDIRILDSATGTGMHAIALAKLGYSVTGVDISTGMVETARRNASEAGEDVHFAVAGFGNTASTLTAEKKGTDQPVEIHYDVVLCLGNSLSHVESNRELVEALRDFSTCLSPGGLLILQNRNFDAVMVAKERWMEPQSYQNSIGEWIFLRFYDFLPDGHIQFNIVTLKRITGIDWKQSVMETRLIPLTQNLLFNALDESGFEQVKAFGSLSNTPFDLDTSGNLVVTARKKK